MALFTEQIGKAKSQLFKRENIHIRFNPNTNTRIKIYNSIYIKVTPDFSNEEEYSPYNEVIYDALFPMNLYYSI